MHNRFGIARAVTALRAVMLSMTILFYANSASASPVTWTLNNATFDDGGTAVGSFTFDADTNTYSSFNISVAGGNTTLFPAFTYSPTTSHVFISTPTDLGIGSDATTLVSLPSGGFRVDAQRTLFMAFGVFDPMLGFIDQPLTNAGGTVGILNTAGLGGDTEFSSLPGFSPPFGQRGFVFNGGATVTSPVTSPVVPEPSSASLLFSGLIALATIVLLRRKRLKINED